MIMLLSTSLIIVLVPVALSSTTNLYVSSYSNLISTLQLKQDAANSSYTLTQISTLNSTSPSPSWLEVDSTTRTLISVTESVPGSVSRYSLSQSGQLTPLNSLVTIREGVHSALYNNGTALAIAHYGGSSVTTYTINPKDQSFSSLQNFTYSTGNSSSDPVSHPHEAVVDPTGTFIVVPDLGSDLLRLFAIDPKTSNVTSLPPQSVPKGTGPRHAVFRKGSSATYLFVLNELSNTLSSFTVNYANSSTTGSNVTLASGAKTASVSLQLIETQSIFGGNTTHPATGAGEIALSPDGKYLITSSRGDNLYNITDPIVAKSTIPSDTLSTWTIDDTKGTLKLSQLSAAGGSFPRMFSMNAKGDMVAVGLQKDGRVVILERDVRTGALGKFIAAMDGLGEVNCVVWDEFKT